MLHVRRNLIGASKTRIVGMLWRSVERLRRCLGGLFRPRRRLIAGAEVISSAVSLIHSIIRRLRPRLLHVRRNLVGATKTRLVGTLCRRLRRCLGRLFRPRRRLIAGAEVISSAVSVIPSYHSQVEAAVAAR